VQKHEKEGFYQQGDWQPLSGFQQKFTEQFQPTLFQHNSTPRGQHQQKLENSYQKRLPEHSNRKLGKYH
jgi:hypothetical protein